MSPYHLSRLEWTVLKQVKGVVISLTSHSLSVINAEVKLHFFSPQRKNRTYEESEEEDEEGVTDVTPTGSRHRLVQAQPGPGMLYKKAHQEPVRSADRPRPPVRAPPPHELEEDSETGESESESESVMTTRTDQVKGDW